MSEAANQLSLDDSGDATFIITCGKCGSSDTEFKNTLGGSESCTWGSIDLVCKACSASKTIYEPF